MTTNSVKFQKGKRTIDLSANGVYMLDEFIPPPTMFNNIMTGGKTEGELVERVSLNRHHPFLIRINAKSPGEAEYHARHLEAFINSGDSVNAVKLLVRSHDDYDFEPLWGQQGAYYRYEVISGSVIPLDASLGTIASATKPHFTVSLFLKPFADGLEQQLAQASGGIYEDVIGKPDGISRGLVVAPASVNTGNYITNPIFEHPTDWNDNWTTQADCLTSQNLDEEYILFGSASLKYTRIASASFVVFTSLTAANTNTHCFSCYAKFPDGSAITDEIQMNYHGDNLTETYDSLGDGWYRVWATHAGETTSGSFTIYANAVGVTFYLDGVQVEESSYPTPVICGDFLGCAHATPASPYEDAHTRTAGRVRLEGSKGYDNAEGTIRVGFLPHIDSTALTGNFRLVTFDAGTDGYLFYDQGNSRWSFFDGTNSAAADTQTFSAYTPVILHITWGPDGLAVYEDGSSIATNATYTPQAVGDYLYIGSTGATLQAPGTLLGCTPFPRAMTAAEVSADYNNNKELVSATDPGLTNRIDHIPWEWTKDGDSTVDGVNDADDDNFLIVNGIPGSYQAKTRIKGRLGAGNFGSDSIGGILMSFIQTDGYIDPGDLYGDDDGTAQASCSGGEYDRIATTGTTAMAWGVGIGVTLDDWLAKQLANKEVRFYYSLEDEDVTTGKTNLLIATALGWGNFEGMFSDYQSPQIEDGQFYNRLSPGIVLPEYSAVLDELPATNISLGLYMKRDDASTDFVRSDFMQLITAPYCRIWSSSTTAEEGFYYASDQRNVWNWDTADDKLETDQFHRQGHWPELMPDQWNAVIIGISDPGSDHIEPNQTNTMVLDSIKVIPRYVIL